MWMYEWITLRSSVASSDSEISWLKIYVYVSFSAKIDFEWIDFVKLILVECKCVKVIHVWIIYVKKSWTIIFGLKLQILASS